jgi:radical SAM superfamily enzyme YgiQ (UPF0313 family)
MHILLVYPRFPKTYWSMHGVLELVGCKVLLPPLGLITVAALLPRSWELRLVDCNVREISDDEWLWADLLMASAMIVQKQDLLRLIRLAAAHQLPVAVGGPYASSTPDAPELQQAQYLILDEGELTIPLFLEALAGGETQGRFSANGDRPDMGLSPIPRFDLLQMEAYNMMAVQFSRGCPFQCEFCDIIVLYGRKPRTKRPPQLLQELDQLYALGWRGDIFLVDDNFIGNKRNVKLLLPELRHWQQRHGYPFRFTTEASVDLSSDPALMQAMVGSGFRRVFLGIETPDQASLRVTNKLQNTRSPLVESVDAITDWPARAASLRLTTNLIRACRPICSISCRIDPWPISPPNSCRPSATCTSLSPTPNGRIVTPASWRKGVAAMPMAARLPLPGCRAPAWCVAC